MNNTKGIMSLTDLLDAAAGVKQAGERSDEFSADVKDAIPSSVDDAKVSDIGTSRDAGTEMAQDPASSEEKVPAGPKDSNDGDAFKAASAADLLAANADLLARVTAAATKQAATAGDAVDAEATEAGKTDVVGNDDDAQGSDETATDKTEVAGEAPAAAAVGDVAETGEDCVATATAKLAAVTQRVDALAVSDAVKVAEFLENFDAAPGILEELLAAQGEGEVPVEGEEELPPEVAEELAALEGEAAAEGELPIEELLEEEGAEEIAPEALAEGEEALPAEQGEDVDELVEALVSGGVVPEAAAKQAAIVLREKKASLQGIGVSWDSLGTSGKRQLASKVASELLDMTKTKGGNA